MKRFVLLSAVMALAVAIVVPAQAKKPPHPTAGMGTGHSCTARDEGYNASGTLMSATLTPAANKGHYDGTIGVDVTRANHKAATGTQTFTLTDARVRFGKGVSSTAPAAGSSVRLHGTVTVLPHGCSSTGFTATVTIRNLEIKQAKPAK
jgi:hypothetical protein